MLNLHIGCCDVIIPNFINTDVQIENWIPVEKKLQIQILDATKKFPYEDNIIDHIYSEHLIEHLPYSGFKNFISESYRCLKPGGIIRTAFPCVDFLIKLYKDPEKYKSYIINHCNKFNKQLINDFGTTNIPVSLIINDNYRMWGHQVMYDINTIKKLFQKFNFKNIKEVPYGESEHDIFKNIEHGNKRGDEFNRLETAIIECEK